MLYNFRKCLHNSHIFRGRSIIVLSFCSGCGGLQPPVKSRLKTATPFQQSFSTNIIAMLSISDFLIVQNVFKFRFAVFQSSLGGLVTTDIKIPGNFRYVGEILGVVEINTYKNCLCRKRTLKKENSDTVSYKVNKLSDFELACVLYKYFNPLLTVGQQPACHCRQKSFPPLFELVHDPKQP